MAISSRFGETSLTARRESGQAARPSARAACGRPLDWRPVRARGDIPGAAGVRIEPWGEGDLPLLAEGLGDAEMTRHVGGPESRERIAKRQLDYQRPGSGQFKVVEDAGGEGIGWVGYWEREWQGAQVYEVGWWVLPAFQGRGVAAAAAAQLLAAARAEGRHRFVHAYPSVENGPSNAICRKLGFTLLGDHEFEYPKGRFMRCNDWRLDLGG